MGDDRLEPYLNAHRPLAFRVEKQLASRVGTLPEFGGKRVYANRYRLEYSFDAALSRTTRCYLRFAARAPDYSKTGNAKKKKIRKNKARKIDERFPVGIVVGL